MAHDHDHPHPHSRPSDEPLPEHLDLTDPDAELPPSGVGRRRLLQSAGVLGTAAATGSLVGAAPASATAPARRRVPRGGYQWLAGDHHIHTQYSPDGLYRVVDQVQHADAYGLDWLVITDHGGPVHARIGVELTNPDIRAARRDFPDMLVFQGLEWNIPAAEHGTVFVHPGREEVAFLKQFENAYDGSVRKASDNTPQNEQLALDGLDVRLRAGGREVPLGGVLTARRGTPVRLVIRIEPARTPNWAQFVPQLAKVDVIRGAVTGAASDRDVFTAAGTRVVRTWDVSGQTQTITLTYDLGRLDEGVYVRLRGSDGNRLAPGLNGPSVDPAGPPIDVEGDADPWRDLWFYTNPMWALPSA